MEQLSFLSLFFKNYSKQLISKIDLFKNILNPYFEEEYNCDFNIILQERIRDYYPIEDFYNLENYLLTAYDLFCTEAIKFTANNFGKSELIKLAEIFKNTKVIKDSEDYFINNSVIENIILCNQDFKTIIELLLK